MILYIHIYIYKSKRNISLCFSLTVERIVPMQKFELLTSLRLSIDFIHAVNTLPPGFLWSSKLNTWHVGLIGSISSVLGIYQIYYKRSLK